MNIRLRPGWGLTTAAVACFFASTALGQQAPSLQDSPSSGQQRPAPSDQQDQIQNQNQGRTQQQGQMERRVMLGVGFERQSGSENGVQIAAVRPQSAAAQANLRPGDTIVSLGGQAVTSPEEIEQIVQGRAAGDTLEIVFLRDGEQHQTEVQFTEMRVGDLRHQAARPSGDSTSRPSKGWLGITLNPAGEATPDQAAGPGVEVRQVYPAGPAAQAGISGGDRILAINGQDITSTEQLLQVLADKEPGETVELVVTSGTEQRTVTPTLDDRSAFAMAGQQEFGDDERTPPFMWRDPSGFQTAIPEHDMMLEQHRRLAEQHERLENLLYEIQQDLQQIKQQLGVRGATGTLPQSAEPDTTRE